MPPLRSSLRTARPPRSLLPLALAGGTLCAGLAATALVWKGLSTSDDRQLRAEFDFRVREVVQRIDRRMATYEQVLRGVQAYLLASPRLPEPAAFRAYADTLRLRQFYPGIQGVGVALLQDGSRGSVAMIEPLDVMNRRALGFDMYGEPVRHAAMARAGATGLAALTGQVRLVQEGRDAGQPGFLMYLPLYEGAGRKTLYGWAYGAFRMNDFMLGLDGERQADLAVAVYDGGASAPASCMYGCAGRAAMARFDTTRTLQIAGRPWLVRVRSNPAFEARMASQQAAWASVGGVIVSMLSAMLVWLLALGRHRARLLARRMTDDLHRSHERLRQERTRLVSILENANDAFVAVDQAGLVTYWNAQAEQAFGWPAAEAVGQPLRALLFPGTQPELDRLLAFAAAPGPAGTGQRLPLQAAARDGTPVPVELSCSIVHHGGRAALHGFIRDLSEEKAVAAREAQRRQELHDARQALHRAQKLEAVGKLTGGVAHDFNNVLQVIYGNVQAVAAAPGGPDVQRRLEGALAAVERGARLSGQLLAFARRQPLEPVVINLARTLRNVDDLLRRALGDGVALTTSVQPGLWNTLVDPDRLENVILNLAINARDAMAGNGTLLVELTNRVLDERQAAAMADALAGDYVMLAVADNGAGMPPDVQERVFEPFFTTKPEGEGTGLGLAMAYGFVRQSGGHIAIDSTVGAGTTMRLFFPRASAPETLPATEPSHAVVGGSEAILLVEDDAAVRDTVAAMLRGLGYTVLEAGDTAAALDLMEGGAAVDLLFTDVVMPGALSAAGLAQAARELRPRIGVLFTSGYAQDAVAGAHLLSKPYRRDELARKLRQALDQIDGLDAADEGVNAAPLAVLVVEDNDDLRDMTCEMLAALGGRATGVASAEAALDALATSAYDALFTDVQLPGISGLELAHRLADDPLLAIVVVSGRALGDEVPPGVRTLAKPYRIDAMEEILAQIRAARGAGGELGED